MVIMILTLFAQLTYVNMLHWIVGLLLWLLHVVTVGIGIILVIQTFDPSTLSVLYNKEVITFKFILRGIGLMVQDDQLWNTGLS